MAEKFENKDRLDGVSGGMDPPPVKRKPLKHKKKEINKPVFPPKPRIINSTIYDEDGNENWPSHEEREEAGSFWDVEGGRIVEHKLYNQ